MRAQLSWILTLALFGCTVIGGMIGATSQSMHNNRPSVRACEQPPIHRTAIDSRVGILVMVAEPNYGK